VFLYLTNADDVHGPATREGWSGAIELLHSYLGIRSHKLKPYVLDVFIDAHDLQGIDE
jgi:hypothetical protein